MVLAVILMEKEKKKWLRRARMEIRAKLFRRSSIDFKFMNAFSFESSDFLRRWHCLSTLSVQQLGV